MVDEVVAAIETIMKVKKKCNDLEEIPKELFFNS
jgi:hypothetical protein